MADHIKFDFGKAQALLDLLGECSRGVGELSSGLGDEVNGAGQWWKGESYEAFKEKYSGAGNSKTAIEALYDRTADVTGHLSKLADAKKSLESNTAKAFK